MSRLLSIAIMVIVVEIFVNGIIGFPPVFALCTGDVASETGIRYQPVLPISRDFFISMRCGARGIEESYLFDCSTLSRGMSWIPAELEDSLSIFFVLLTVIWDSRLICMVC